MEIQWWSPSSAYVAGIVPMESLRTAGACYCVDTGNVGTWPQIVLVNGTVLQQRWVGTSAPSLVLLALLLYEYSSAHI